MTQKYFVNHISCDVRREETEVVGTPDKQTNHPRSRKLFRSIRYIFHASIAKNEWMNEVETIEVIKVKVSP